MIIPLHFINIAGAGTPFHTCLRLEPSTIENVL